MNNSWSQSILTLTWHDHSKPWLGITKMNFLKTWPCQKCWKEKETLSEHSNKSDQVVVLNFIELLDICLLTLDLLEPGFAPFQMLFLVHLQLLPNPPQSMMGPRSGKHSNKDIRDDMAYHQKLKTPAKQITTERQQWGIFMNMIHRDFPPAVTPQHRRPDPRASLFRKGKKNSNWWTKMHWNKIQLIPYLKKNWLSNQRCSWYSGQFSRFDMVRVCSSSLSRSWWVGMWKVFFWSMRPCKEWMKLPPKARKVLKKHKICSTLI